jgi:hypothetical protein
MTHPAIGNPDPILFCLTLSFSVSVDTGSKGNKGGNKEERDGIGEKKERKKSFPNMLVLFSFFFFFFLLSCYIKQERPLSADPGYRLFRLYDALR